MTTGPRFRRATTEESPAIAALLTEVAEEMRARDGRTGWPVPYPVEEVRASAGRAELFVTEEGARVVATFQLLWEDPRFWGPQPTVAGYLHKLAVERGHRGRGLGAVAVAAAASEVAAAGRTLLRLDCLAAAAPLVAFYRREGFAPVREVEAGPRADRRRYLLMEQRVGGVGVGPGDDPKSAGGLGSPEVR